jgi:hypothetical protein
LVVSCPPHQVDNEVAQVTLMVLLMMMPLK